MLLLYNIISYVYCTIDTFMYIFVYYNYVYVIYIYIPLVYICIPIYIYCRCMYVVDLYTHDVCIYI